MSGDLAVMDQPTALVVPEQRGLMPVFSGAQMTAAFTAYRELQKALDTAMPDQIMDIRGRMFRKKGYWRAVATAFNLNVGCVKEESDDFGWRVVYRATSQNGRQVEGDGACENEEKGEGQDTEHNVRSHAHTRAFNRAVSNLVGFGEVSAEEINGRSRQPATYTPTPPSPDRPAPPEGYRFIDDYRLQNGWHDVKFLHFDAQGGAMRLSTKTEVGFIAGEAFREGVPVKVEWKAKPDIKGEGWLNKVEQYHQPAVVIEGQTIAADPKPF